MLYFLFLILMMVVSAAVTLFATYSFFADKHNDLQSNHSALETQHAKLQEQYRALQDYWQQRWQQVVERYSPIIKLDEEAHKIQAEIARLQRELHGFQNNYNNENQRFQSYAAQIAQQQQLLNNQYQSAMGIYNRLRSEIALLEENMEDISFGLYKPHYDFSTSEEFKRELESARNVKKQLVRNDKAMRFMVEWYVGGSRAEGLKMQKQCAKLMLRAFNGECDAAIANCKWNNITRMIERVNRAYSAINQLGSVMQVVITPDYLSCSLHELQLEFEYQEKKRAELEEQRSIRERLKEEERVQRELERAESEARQDEARYESALEKARKEISTAQGQKFSVLSERIQELERQLREAHEKRERAISMAQLTRRGYVYIISNIGSFGTDVYKIGLTRRLEPMDRVRELGDASVPFTFDVHGMIFSDDAPALESALHTHFRNRSVNMVNDRKEFFAVSLDEIEEVVKSKGLHIELTKTAEAREYRETLSIRQKLAAPNSNGETVRASFPTSLVNSA